MGTITAILEANDDGTLHLPIPPELRKGKIKVTATLESADSSVLNRSLPKATPEMLAKRLVALKKLRALGGLKDIITDASTWQREMRTDRPLPGRE